MKIEEKIYDLNCQTDDEECQKESKRLYHKYHTLGLLFFISGLILTLAAFGSMIGMVIYLATNKMTLSENRSFSLWFMMLFLAALIFGILAVIGNVFRAIAKTIIIKDKKN